MSSIALDIRRARLLPSRRALGRLLAFVATGAFLVLFVRQGSLGEAWQAMLAVPLWSVAAALASILAAVALTALRWRYLLAAAGIEAPLRRLFTALAVGAAVNNLAPARAGDVVRVVALREHVAVPASAAAGTLVAERLLDGFTLALWIVLGSLLAGVGGPVLAAGVGFTALTALGIAAAALAAAAPDRAERLVALAMRRLPRRASRPVASAAAGFLGGLAVFRSPRLLAQAFAASLALWLADVGLYASLAHGFGLDLGVGGWFLLEGIGNLALAVPATAAGIGSFDYLTLVGARSLGVGGATAAAYVLAVHAFVVLPMTILGVLLLPTLRKRRDGAQRGARGRRTLQRQLTAQGLHPVDEAAQPRARRQVGAAAGVVGDLDMLARGVHRQDRRRQPFPGHADDRHRGRRSRRERLQRQSQPSIGQHRRVQPAAELAQLLDQPQRQRQRDQPLLRPVVQVPL